MQCLIFYTCVIKNKFPTRIFFVSVYVYSVCSRGGFDAIVVNVVKDLHVCVCVFDCLKYDLVVMLRGV